MTKRKGEELPLLKPGQQVGEWTLLAYKVVIRNRTPVYAWECRCSCGHVRFHRNEYLAKGRSKSCGCKNNNRRNSRRTSRPVLTLG